MKRSVVLPLLAVACGPSKEDMNQEYLARRDLAAMVAYGRRGVELRPYIDLYKKRCAKCRPPAWCAEEAERIQFHGEAALSDVVCAGWSGSAK